MRPAPAGIALGLASLVVGLGILVLVQGNLVAQMDRVDRDGTAGNLFALDVLPLGSVGFVIVLSGIVLLVRQRPRRTARR